MGRRREIRERRHDFIQEEEEEVGDCIIPY